MDLHELRDRLDYLENCGVSSVDLEGLFAVESRGTPIGSPPLSSLPAILQDARPEEWKSSSQILASVATDP
jgi:hypothetical protein